VTARKEAEDALRASEERYRRLVETAHEGIWTLDAGGRTTYVNWRMAELLGYAPEEMIGRVHTDFMSEQDRPKGEVEMESRRQGTAAVWDQRYRRKDGSELWTVASCNTLYDAEGKFAGALGMFTDITGRKRVEAERQALLDSERAARAEAERASTMKDEFLATLSHELRTPLNAILGWAQILARGTRDAEDLADGLRTIERNARAQTQIIEDLLDMSRIISGKVRLDVQRVDLAGVVREAVATAKPSAEAKGIRLQAVLDPRAGPVSGDPARLQQVMWNLLTNAVKFTPKGGRVQVLLERVNSHFEVSVSDTGEGIKPEFLPHVFDRFRQADATTTRRHGGLGLGLSIVKQLVELHGGSVRVVSAGLGHGTTFTLSLPLPLIQPEPDPDVERHPPRAASSATVPQDACVQIAGVKVLVVDDEADARALMRRLLEDCQARVITAGSAAEALELVRAAKPDVLVSDIGMPGEDGYSLIERVRALGPEHGGQVPSVALTAYARVEDRVTAILAGFQMHLAKPVEPAELIAMVASLAGRTATEQAKRD
jgi:PAS domain S-box-containing protein